MTSNPETDDAAMLAAAVLKRIETENIRNVRLILTDLYGVARGKVVAQGSPAELMRSSNARSLEEAFVELTA